MPGEVEGWFRKKRVFFKKNAKIDLRAHGPKSNLLPRAPPGHFSKKKFLTRTANPTCGGVDMLKIGQFSRFGGFFGSNYTFWRARVRA